MLLQACRPVFNVGFSSADSATACIQVDAGYLVVCDCVPFVVIVG